MKQRLLTNWNVSRVIFLTLGTAVIVHSILNKEWIGLAFGGYFAAMGLFAFGCASGACFGGNCTAESDQYLAEALPEVEFEEVGGK